jgi:nucleotide-binding universal stress UspA family protein
MRILVATDGSADASAAVGWLSHLSLTESPVMVLSVVTLPPSSIDIPTVRSYYQTLLDYGEGVVKAARDVLVPSCPGVETQVRPGDPREQIIAAAEAWKADLLVLGARGLAGLAEVMLGSVSMAVLRSAHCPVLVVKGKPRGLGRAVVAVDGSSDSRAAACFFASLPLRSPIAVRLLSVLEAPSAIAPGMGFRPAMLAAPEALFGERRTVLEGMLARLATDVRPVAQEVECSVVMGHPTTEIETAANEPDIGLVVVGARGLGTLRRWLLGSVSERVVHRAPCPVLVVRPAGARPDAT